MESIFFMTIVLVGLTGLTNCNGGPDVTPVGAIESVNLKEALEAKLADKEELPWVLIRGEVKALLEQITDKDERPAYLQGFSVKEFLAISTGAAKDCHKTELKRRYNICYKIGSWEVFESDEGKRAREVLFRKRLATYCWSFYNSLEDECDQGEHRVPLLPEAANYDELELTTSIDLEELSKHIGELLAKRTPESPALGIQVQQLLARISDKRKRPILLMGSNVADLLKLSTWTLDDCDESLIGKRSATCEKFSKEKFHLEAEEYDPVKYANEKYVKRSLGVYCWQYVYGMLHQCKSHQKETISSVLGGAEISLLEEFEREFESIYNWNARERNILFAPGPVIKATLGTMDSDKVKTLHKLCLKMEARLGIAFETKTFKKEGKFSREYEHCKIVNEFFGWPSKASYYPQSSH